MSVLQEPGDLSRTPLAAILLEAWNLRATGELVVKQAGGDSRLWFRDGMPVGAQTFAGFHPLGQLLLQRGLIDVETLGRSLAEVAGSHRRQGEVLVEMGAVSQEVVDRALEDQQAGYLSLIANLSEGAYAFDASVPVPGWASRVLVAPLRAVVDALATGQGASLRAGALALASGPIVLGPGYADLAIVFSWTAGEEALLRRLAAGTTIDEALATPGLSRENAEAALAALLLLGLAASSGDAVDLSQVVASAVSPPPGPRPAGGPQPPAAPGLPPAVAPATAAPVEPPVDMSRRSDPEVARARRQRLLARAMQNMGVGPLASGPPPEAGPAPRPAVPRGSPPPAAAPPAGARAAAPGYGPEAEIRKALETVLPLARAPDLFARLGVPRGATSDEVKDAYLRKVKQFHPDRLASLALSDIQDALREVLSALNEAYAVLSDRNKRSEYLARTASGGRAATEAAAAAARADFQKAELARKAGDHARARLFLESAVRSDRRPDYLVALALATMASGGPEGRERAHRHLEEAMKDPACAAAFLAAGRMARDDNDPDRAERLMKAALRADPKNEEAARELKEIQGRRLKRAEARADAKK
jgi:curved DNA-binding protein CbpA